MMDIPSTLGDVFPDATIPGSPAAADGAASRAGEPSRVEGAACRACEVNDIAGHGPLARLRRLGRVRDCAMAMGTLTRGMRYDGSDCHRHMLFATTTLPLDVSVLMPRSSLLRVDAPAVSVLDREGGMTRLQLESIQLGAVHDLQVADRADAAMWWELFDPITIDGLVSSYSIQWVQHARTIVFVCETATDPRDGVNQTELDTLCAGGPWMVQRFCAAA